MEFQQLEMFVAVVETGSLRLGAERVFRTAPAVSIALRKLEEELGSSLFDRSEHHKYSLTAAGRMLYSYANRILSMRNEVTVSIRDLSREQRANLRLGTHESLTLYLLPSLLNNFKEANPELKSEVICGNTERLLTALANGTIEIALLGDAPDEPHLERHFIMRDELVLITSPKHRLAGLSPVRVPDLADEFLIVQGTKSMLRERILQAFRESETPFKVGVENVAIESIKRMVAQGLGIGFVPLMCVRDELSARQLVTVQLNGVRKDWDLWLVWRKDHSLSAAAKAFVNLSLDNPQSVEAEPEGIPEGESKGTPNSRKPFPITSRKLVHC